MKKAHCILFIVICLCICLLPSVGMLFFPTTESTENRAMAKEPRLITDSGEFNTSIFDEFDAYFNEHMAGRNHLLFADAKIQADVLGTSNVSGVISGTNGWLYYASTLPDYLGENPLPERDLRNLAHNFSVIQQYLEERGIAFVLTLPPNKNTLYPEDMPYYDKLKVEETNNLELLASYLAEEEINYVNLLELFDRQEETLYLKRDSHWNGKGAAMAYDALSDGLERRHTDYIGTAEPAMQTVRGDLNKMLYSFYGAPEQDAVYVPAGHCTYKEGDDVEDGKIVTANEEGRGMLLMFRDSFANTLIPFFSEDFATAVYSKAEPNEMEMLLETYPADCVVIEKVERNIRDYLDNPPVLSAPQTEEPMKVIVATTETTVSVDTCENDTRYYAIRGSIDPKRMETDTEIVVSVNGTFYRAFQTGGNDFLLYLKKEDFTEDTVELAVFALSKDTCIQTVRTKTALPQ